LIYETDAALFSLDCSLGTVLLAQAASYTDLGLYTIRYKSFAGQRGAPFLDYMGCIFIWKVGHGA
jgi:hypothetical protein